MRCCDARPYIFNDNFRKNITVTDEPVDEEKLYSACRTSNILSFIESLPLGFYTKLGAEGTAISGGQNNGLPLQEQYIKAHTIFS